jgi:hypothetical protein
MGKHGGMPVRGGAMGKHGGLPVLFQMGKHGGLPVRGRQPGFPGYSAGAERLAQLVCGGS